MNRMRFAKIEKYYHLLKVGTTLRQLLFKNDTPIDLNSRVVEVEHQKGANVLKPVYHMRWYIIPATRASGIDRQPLSIASSMKHVKTRQSSSVKSNLIVL